MERIEVWSDPAQISGELKRRFDAAADARRPWERIWRKCMDAAYRNSATSPNALFVGNAQMPAINGTSDGYSNNIGENIATDESSEIYCNYIAKDVRYLLSQLSNNPPSVIPQPTSAEPKDRQAAEAANNVTKYAIRQYRLQEKKDLTALWALTTGTGFTRQVWDAQLGDPLEFNPATGELITEGDISVTVPSVWDIYKDPIATNWEEVRYVFQRFWMAKEAAEHYFGEAIKPYLGKCREADRVEVFQYWEKGLPVNGFQGRFCWMTPEGTLLGDKMGVNSHGARTKLKNGQMFRKATLPYHIFTDIDVPGQVYGLPTILFTAEMQRELNMLDRLIFTNIRANGSSHMMVSDDCSIEEDSITNNPMDIIKYSGTKPDVSAPLPVSPIIVQVREALAAQIPEANGINESQYGKIGRETSGSAMSMATQNGQSLRARTFTKYVQYIEDLYRALLIIVQEKWDTPRLLVVEGREKSYSTIQFQASDIESGYEFCSKYGTDFSLDPVQRRKEILELWPILKDMELDPRQMGSLLKLNDLDSMLATIDLAFDRQREIFDRMIGSPSAEYIAPEDDMDNKNMLRYANHYRMTAEFDRLANPKVKENIKRHIKERTDMEAKKTMPAVAPGIPAPGGEQAAPPTNLGALLGTM